MNLDQRRMMCAYQLIENAGDQRKLWKGAVDSFGAEVQRSGLLQALAFIHRGPNKAVAAPLSAGIRQHLADLHHLEGRATPSLLTEVRDLPAEAYMRITLEVLSLSVWLRRAAQILIPDDNPSSEKK
jgi:hypothetical protein